MLINEIYVSTESFESDYRKDIIYSNNHYITKLFQKGIKEDKISEDALKSYYVDFYLSHILHGSFSSFIKNFSNKPKILYYIDAGLKALKCTKHLALFQKVFFTENKLTTNEFLNNNTLDTKFKNINKIENLVYFNHRWLMNHPQLIILNSDDISKKIEKDILKYKDEKQHIKIIKQLCHNINEDFIAITAGDINNIYNQSWYLKTTKNHYYTIQKKNIITMYNSFTKKAVTKGKVRNGKIILNKTEKFNISSFISKVETVINSVSTPKLLVKLYHSSKNEY